MNMRTAHGGNWRAGFQLALGWKELAAIQIHLFVIISGAKGR